MMRGVLILLFSLCVTVNSARILAVFPIPSISHQVVFRVIWKELALRGHEVTVITPNPLNYNLTNLTEIDVSVAYDLFKRIDYTNIRRDVAGALYSQRIFFDSFEYIFKLEMETAGVQELLRKPEDYFDLLLIEVHMPNVFGFQHKFKAPSIAISSLTVRSIIHGIFGNPIHPVLQPCIFSELSNLDNSMTLWDKFGSLYITVGGWIQYKLLLQPNSDKNARSYFGNDMPYIEDLIRNTSLLLLNLNPILSDRRPLAPNVIAYHNIHTSDGKQPLPKDLQKVLDNAENGVVYFSLGTNVRFDHLQGNTKEIILEALGELPYTVLCKWEAEDIAGKPKNVVLRKWLPQEAVLAHPNVRVFVTQGGLQSSEEAILNGVPLVVIPFLGDQPMNAKILTTHGMAETILPKALNKDILKKAILKVAKDEKYRVKAQELRGIFVDQPQSGVDKVVWWCEYVIRHKGAKHLRSPAADIPLYEYFMLDVLAVIVAALLMIYKLVVLILRILVRLLTTSKSRVKPKKKAKKH